MINPARRMWLYPIDANTLEIVILGDVEIATTYAAIKGRCEAWIGWDRVDQLVNGSDSVVGLRVHLSALATHADPIAEALLMLRKFHDLRWSGGAPANDSAIGMVGTW